MRKSGFFGSSALRSATLLISAAAFASPSFAQGTTQDPPETLNSEVEVESGENATAGAQGEEADGQAITVTGSRIRRPNLESAVPVTSIGGDRFIQQGDTNIGDTLNELPQLSSTFSQQNPGLGVGIAGLNLLDLRGLGTSRTLVLVNGRRHVAADIQNNAASVDINTIPNDLIERVDIVTGAQSAVYGSDAIAGVVNFVLRRDFEGLQLRGNASVAEEGYGGEQYVSAMYGMNFADDRGNITVHGEFNNQDRLFGSDIPRYRQTNGLAVVDVDPASAENGSDGVPDRIFVRDQRSATINRFGLVPVSQRLGGPAPCGVSGASNAAPFNCTFLFGPDGRLVPQTGDRLGTTLNGFFLGGNGQTGREGTLLSILPGVERYNFNLLGHFEFSEALEFFVEAKYSRVDAQGNNAGATFTQGGSFVESGAGSAVNGQRERPRLDNPFLNPADRAFLANAFLTSDCDPTITGAACSANPTAGNRLSAAEEAAIAAGTFRFVLGKQFLDLGVRDERFRRETYRAVAGFRGTFNEDWNYEISANYGKFKEDTVISGYVDRQRFLLSLDAGIDPANPSAGVQCRAKFDPTARVPFRSAALNDTQNAFIASRLQSDIAACVPYNPFGAGGPNNAAAADYFTYAAQNKAELEQFVVSAFVSGDTSQFFELPGGPVRFAVGAEYRREDALYINDPLVLQGVTNALVLGTADPEEATKVKEAYAELQLPILRDTPFFHDLTVTGAGRISDYSTIGTVYTYNGSVEWSPVRDIRFRANYGRSVRAPNVAETGFPLVPNFAPGFIDPCSGAAIGAGSATRAANCAADLGPLLANLESLGAPSLAVLSGSNPNLNEEKSDFYSVGVVVQPRFLPGFSLSADYFDITVKDVIVALDAQTIADNCYDAPTLDNPFCPLFERYRGPEGGGAFDEIPGQIQGNTLIQAGVNYASRVRRGIDFEVAYRANIFNNVRLNTNLIFVYNLENSDFEDPADPEFADRILGELGTPETEFRWDTDLTVGKFTFGYRMRYVGEMYVNNYEDFNEFQGRPAQNLDYAEVIEYPDTFYHDIRFELNLPNRARNDAFQLYAGVDNLLNTFPPLGLTGTGSGGAGNDRSLGNAAIYETQGRTFYAGFRARF